MKKLMNKKIRFVDSQKGFTLVEVMVTLVLAVMTITAVGAALDNGIRLTADNRSHLYALNALREQMEVLRNTSFTTISGYASSTSFTNTQLAKLQNGTGTLAIANGAGADIKKVTLTVSWTLKNGSTRTESVTSYITRQGLNGL